MNCSRVYIHLSRRQLHSSVWFRFSRTTIGIRILQMVCGNTCTKLNLWLDMSSYGVLRYAVHSLSSLPFPTCHADGMIRLCYRVKKVFGPFRWNALFYRAKWFFAFDKLNTYHLIENSTIKFITVPTYYLTRTRNRYTRGTRSEFAEIFSSIVN